MSKFISIILICLFLGVAIFSFSKTVSLFKEVETLNQQIEGTYKPKIADLEKQNSKINDELTKVQNALLNIEEEDRVLREQLVARESELKQAKASLEEKENALAQVTNRYNELNTENNLLKDKFSSLYAEFIEARKTLSSIDALKKVIKDLKAGSKKNKKRVIVYKKTNKDKENNKKQSNLDEKDIEESYGNRGYLIKDGENTFVPKARIRVITIEE